MQKRKYHPSSPRLERGERKNKRMPFYASFWFLDHGDGDWSVHRSKKDASDKWYSMGRKRYLAPVTWVRLADRADLIAWLNLRKSQDQAEMDKKIINVKRMMVHDLLGIPGEEGHENENA